MSTEENLAVDEEVLDFGDAMEEHPDEGVENPDEGVPPEVTEQVMGEQGNEVVAEDHDMPATENDCEPEAAGKETNESAKASEEQAAVIAEQEEQQQQEDVPKEDDDNDDPTKMPPHGTEVFISRLPRGATDAQVKELCEQCGEIFNIRIPKDPGNAGQNKGYAFAVYKTKESAQAALGKLNQQDLSDFPGQKVSVTVSLVKNRLFIGNIPKDMNKDAIKAALATEVKGLEEVELLLERETNQNRGFGFLEFYNHGCAEAARRRLSRPDYRLGDRPVTVTWAEPRETRRDEAEQEKVKAIYVGGLPDNVEEKKLRQIFAAYGEIETIAIPRNKENPDKNRDYCFIHYKERASALRAVEESETAKHEMDDKPLLVHIAKPQLLDSRSAYPGGGYGRGGARGGYYNPSRGGGPGGYAGGRGYRGRGGPGRGPPPRGRSMGPSYSGGYDAYEEDWGEDWGDDYEGGYGGYGGYSDYRGYGSSSGMAMVPMMLPSGQVGYVLAGQGGASRSRAGVYSAGYRGSSAGYAPSYGSSYSSGGGSYGGAYGGGYSAGARSSSGRAPPRSSAGYSSAAVAASGSYPPRQAGSGSSGGYANGSSYAPQSSAYPERRSGASAAPSSRYRPY